MLPRIVLAAATVVVLTLTSGCSSADPDPIVPTPEGPTVEELFGTEEDARLAAEQALHEYWAASNKAYRAPDEGIESLAPFVTPERLRQEGNTAEQYAKQGFFQQGDVGFDSVRFQSLFDEGGKTVLVVTMCADYSDYKLVNGSGAVAKARSKYEKYQHLVYFELETRGADVHLTLSEATHRWEKPC